MSFTFNKINQQKKRELGGYLLKKKDDFMKAEINY